MLRVYKVIQIDVPAETHFPGQKGPREIKKELIQEQGNITRKNIGRFGGHNFTTEVLYKLKKQGKVIVQYPDGLELHYELS